MKAIATIVLFAISSYLFGQQITLSGTITDAKTGESLISANVYDPVTLQGTVTNLYGYYSFRLQSGKATVAISYTGYQTLQFDYNLHRDTIINFALEPSLQLEEVTISAESPIHKIRSTQMGTIQLSPTQTDKIPVLLGETDIIKTFQLMPGVQGGTEGTSGFYVRGGGPDQNLILLDGVPVYNANHLFGFMSVFNSDAIRNVTLIKGGFPARYGGRLSSVVDIRMKEGNNKELKGDAAIGLLSSKLTLEGPIFNENTSFMISGRRSYIDVLSYPFQMMANKKYNDGTAWVGYYLQDFNAKLNHKINDRHRLFFSMYTGVDKFFLKDESTYKEQYSEEHYSSTSKEKIRLQWGNLTGAARWNYVIKNNLFSNVTATISDYKFRISDDYKSENTQGISSTENYSYYFEYYSQIRDYAVKADFDYILNNTNYVKFGVSNTLHFFSPGVTIMRDKSSNYDAEIDTIYGNKNIPTNEFNAYIENDMIITPSLKINAGVHYSNFNVQGKMYHSFEPRVSGRLMLSTNLALKASYAKMQQYLHLLANSSMGLPTDLWVPATKKIKPQESWQAALGFSYALFNKYEFSIEGYYKDLKNIIEYSEGASFFDLNNGNWEDIVTAGKGESYGAEFLIQKNSGNLTGWIGYTLSWANRTFDDISFGKTFPYQYDSRHDISIVATYAFNPKVDVGATWVYRTGYPFTLADEKFLSPAVVYNNQNIINNNTSNPYNYNGYINPSVAMPIETIEYFESRNNYRMPDYHRLDVGINMHKQKKRYLRTWSLGIYNAYGKNNPFMIYNSVEYNWYDETSKSQLKQISIFNFIPYARWSVKF